MAVAITEFSGFCGFLPVEDIAKYLSAVPELEALVGRSNARAFEDAVTNPETIQSRLKDVFTGLMKADSKVVEKEVAALVSRYEAGGAKGVEHGVKELVLELNKQYPGDVGIFCVFLLNIVKLEPGQAIFLRANEPHAYIYGGE